LQNVEESIKLPESQYILKIFRESHFLVWVENKKIAHIQQTIAYLTAKVE